MTKFLRTVSLLMLALLMTSCGSAPSDTGSAALASAAALATALSGTDTPAGSNTDGATSRLCSLFTQAEIEAMLGAKVGVGKVAAMNTACQWSGSADATYVQIQVIDDTNYWTKPSLGEGYEELNDIGKEAFVIPEMGGWSAGALTNKVVTVAMNGGKASRDTTVKLLRTVLERL